MTELLEHRTLLTTVTSVLDTIDAGDGQTTLREAILEANTSPGADLIDFNLPGPGPHTIALTGGVLPTITGQVEIDGSQELVVIDASPVSLPSTAFLIHLNGAGTAGSSLRGLTFEGTQSAITATNSSHLTFEDINAHWAGTSRVGSGILIRGGQQHVFDRISVSNHIRGIHLLSVTDSTVTNSVLQNNSSGIRADTVSGRNFYSMNDVSGSANGIQMLGTIGGDSADANIAIATSIGVYVKSGFGNAISNNILSDAVVAIRIEDDTDVAISGNTFTGGADGIEFRDFENVVIQPSGYSHPGSDPYSGLPVITLDDSVSQISRIAVSLINPHSVHVRGIDLTSTGTAQGTALAAFGGHATTVDNITVANRLRAIDFTDTTDSFVTGSTLRSNWSGIRSTGASGQNTFEGNTILGTGSAVVLSGTLGGSTAATNVAPENDFGIVVSKGTGHEILNNTVPRSVRAAIVVTGDREVRIEGNVLDGSRNGVELRNLDQVIVTPADADVPTLAPGENWLPIDVDLSRVTDIGLLLHSANDSTVEGMDFSYAGNSPSGTGLYIADGSNNTIHGVQVSDRISGIRIDGAHDTAVHCSELLNNSTGVFVSGAPTTVEVTMNHFGGNTLAVRNSNASSVDARFNYWGAPDGASTNGGSGDAYSGNVDASQPQQVVPECARTNLPPELAVDLQLVAIDEGSVATNSGTWSDAVDDNVTLSASVGNVVQNANGTWDWSVITSDGPDQSQFVTITAADQNDESTDVSFSLVVNNVAPSIATDSDSVVVDEGDTATNSGTFSDPGLDAVSLTVSVGTVVDNGNGTWNWSFDTNDGPDQSHTVVVTAVDSDGAGSTTTFSVTVNNVAPVVTGIASSHFSLENKSTDGTVLIAGAFSDPGLDTHTVTVNWGDGTIETASIDQAADIFNGGHDYSSGGIFSISVTVIDSDGAVSETATSTAVVAGVGLVEGTLYIIGTDGKDIISVREHPRRDRLTVDARFDVGRRRRGHGGSDGGSDGGSGRFRQHFAASAVDLIVAYGCDGDDHIHLGGGGSDGGSDGGVDIASMIFGGGGRDHLHGGQGNDIIDGGAGDDHLSGRAGNDVLSGGDGDDRINGGLGRDLLIGGTGRDRLRGERNDDLVIGGSTEFETGELALKTALSAWLNDDLSTALLSLGPVTDDGERDDLKGGQGCDELIGGIGDKVRR